ncbi:cation efflux protein, CzcI family [Rhodoferax sp.]|uniref:cation efflux protein, CzcI family n=1 Tax=Rhodoferax sp. TaxID=50421 RepID=UPI003A0FB9E8
MRRWLLVFLLVLLPLQLTWAAVSTYCQHESMPSVQHIGHHAHKHATVTTDNDGSAGVDGVSVENECGVCHANCSVAFQSSSKTLRLTTGPVRIHANAAMYLAHYQDLPERPQWVSLV